MNLNEWIEVGCTERNEWGTNECSGPLTAPNEFNAPSIQFNAWIDWVQLNEWRKGAATPINCLNSSRALKREWMGINGLQAEGVSDFNQSISIIQLKEWMKFDDFSTNERAPLLSHSIKFNWIELQQLEWYYNSKLVREDL